MSVALSSIAGDGKRYAFVGVPCFVKAISLLMRQDARLAEQIRFRDGLVCGHLKSAAFAECLSWQTGVTPEELAAVDFRVKDPDPPATRYRFCDKAKYADRSAERRGGKACVSTCRSRASPCHEREIDDDRREE